MVGFLLSVLVVVWLEGTLLFAQMCFIRNTPPPSRWGYLLWPLAIAISLVAMFFNYLEKNAKK